MRQMKVQWKHFFENSSTQEALCDFVKGKLSFEQLKKQCWSIKCKEQVDKLKFVTHFNLKKAQDSAAKALARRGFFVKKIKLTRARYLIS